LKVVPGANCTAGRLETPTVHGPLCNAFTVPATLPVPCSATGTGCAGVFTTVTGADPAPRAGDGTTMERVNPTMAINMTTTANRVVNRMGLLPDYALKLSVTQLCLIKIEAAGGSRHHFTSMMIVI
jgi:hypothetical protein